MWHDCCEGPKVTQALLAELGSGPGRQEGVGWGEVCPPNLRTTRIYTLGWLLPPSLSPSRLFIWEVVPPVLAGMSILSTPPPSSSPVASWTTQCLVQVLQLQRLFAFLDLHCRSAHHGRAPQLESKKGFCRTVRCRLQWCPSSTMCIT